ncbi:hypothetical protein MCOR07_009705 [Pyricularia oryzae]|uniref:Uncharacterized protein n=1 Tax=Pyricularia oryzae TaxID=318829 RepID=A0A4P7MY09_PYROR|nr:hypothetical protein MCOR01_005586 [Pyricularia oryzae]KAI6261243.1 hypothetical protein MCOR19_002542 [Pyricularia oryzae]KAI6267234.1 hypothetical protein MCOR26_009806 [Pyricularia oryzae]KAI6296108.1 hypothetical protein MCOR29_011335 [Pyricularia oryzae]KAI6310379.1 hypothetical protein MCOR30_011140 [Pyricularia oryzae]
MLFCKAFALVSLFAIGAISSPIAALGARSIEPGSVAAPRLASRGVPDQGADVDGEKLSGIEARSDDKQYSGKKGSSKKSDQKQGSRKSTGWNCMKMRKSGGTSDNQKGNKKSEQRETTPERQRRLGMSSSFDEPWPFGL